VRQVSAQGSSPEIRGTPTDAPFDGQTAMSMTFQARPAIAFLVVLMLVGTTARSAAQPGTSQSRKLGAALIHACDINDDAEALVCSTRVRIPISRTRMG